MKSRARMKQYGTTRIDELVKDKHEDSRCGFILNHVPLHMTMIMTGWGWGWDFADIFFQRIMGRIQVPPHMSMIMSGWKWKWKFEDYEEDPSLPSYEYENVCWMKVEMELWALWGGSKCISSSGGAAAASLHFTLKTFLFAPSPPVLNPYLRWSALTG